jgi:transcriptional regulator with XRE-family HTH domain
MKNHKDNSLLQLIGKNVKKHRLMQGMTLDVLAKLCESEKSVMSRIELGYSNSTVLNLKKICNALSIQLTELFHEA